MWPLCRVDEVPEDGARGFELEGHALVLVRMDGRLHLYVNWCPHLGVELNYQPDEFLDMDRRHIQCSTHGALFATDTGLCFLGPCKGQSLVKVPFRVEGGEVQVTALPERKS